MKQPAIAAAPAAAPQSAQAPAAGRRLRGLVLPAALLAAWQAATAIGLFEPSQLPPPADVVAAAAELLGNGSLVEHLLVSLGRVLVGFLIGSGLALLLAVAVGLSPQVAELADPLIQALRTIPSLAWVPLLILWLGIDEAPKLTLVAIGAFFPVYTTLSAGIRQIDRKLVEAGLAYGMRGLTLARQVLLPAALPSFFTGLRAGLAQSWLFLVAAELIAASRGLGFLLVDSQNTGRVDIILLSITCLALLGKLSDGLIQIGERTLLRWSDAYRPR